VPVLTDNSTFSAVLLNYITYLHSGFNRQTWYPPFPFYCLYWSLSTLPAPRRTRSFNESQAQRTRIHT